MNTISRTLITVVVVLLGACAQPQSGRAWTFDRQMTVPVDVRILWYPKQEGAQPLQADAKHHKMTIDFDVAVERRWEAVNIYTVTDWKTNQFGSRMERILGQVSEPAGYVRPPESVSGHPSDIPASVRKELDKPDPDLLPLGNYPVKMTWFIVTDDDVRTKIVDGETIIFRSSPPPTLRVSESNLENLLNCGVEKFDMIFVLAPEGWSDLDSLELFRKGQPTGSRRFGQGFDRSLVLRSLGK